MICEIKGRIFNLTDFRALCEPGNNRDAGKLLNHWKSEDIPAGDEGMVIEKKPPVRGP